jgi:hypothetical protein
MRLETSVAISNLHSPKSKKAHQHGFGRSHLFKCGVDVVAKESEVLRDGFAGTVRRKEGGTAKNEELINLKESMWAVNRRSLAAAPSSSIQRFDEMARRKRFAGKQHSRRTLNMLFD